MAIAAFVQHFIRAIDCEIDAVNGLSPTMH
jgi:hypothetical protein